MLFAVQAFMHSEKVQQIVAFMRETAKILITVNFFILVSTFFLLSRQNSIHMKEKIYSFLRFSYEKRKFIEFSNQIKLKENFLIIG